MTQISRAQKNRESSLGFLVQTLARRIETEMRDRLHQVEIDIKIFANLMFLSDVDGINQRQLGEKLEFPEYYTSRNVDAMVKAGYAERRPDPASRRSFLIFLTAKGRAKAGLLPKIVREVNDIHLKNLTEDERETLISLLQKTTNINHN